MDFDSSRPSSGELAAILAEPALAAALGQGGAIFVAAVSPPRLIFASGPLQTYFKSTNLDEIANHLLAKVEGKPSLAALFAHLTPGAPGRLERMRIVFGRRVETVTVLLRRMPPPASVVIGMVAGVRVAQPPGGFPPALFATTTAAQIAPALAAVPAPVPMAPAPAAALQAAPSPSGAVARLAADLAARHANAPFIRFLWQTDAAGRLTSLTGPFCEVLGCSTGALIGFDLVDLASACGPQGAAALRAAFAARQSWSGLDLLWPVAKAQAAVPITLGALPTLDGQGAFLGYRGFGVIHIQRLEPSLHDWTPPAPQRKPDPAPAVVQPPEPSREPAPAPMPFARLTNVVSLRDRRQEAAPIDEPPAAPSEQPEAPAPGPRSPARNREASNLVELSSTERTAFREIARALGARVDDSAPSRRESSEDRAQRIRDLIDLATVRAVAAGPEGRQRGRAPVDEPPQAPPPPPPRASAPEPVTPTPTPTLSVFDDIAANAPAVLDRLPVGVLVSRMEIPVFLNRTLLDLLGFADADAFHAAGGLDAIFMERPLDRESPGCASIRAADGEVMFVDVRIQAIEWDGAPATLTTFRKPEGEASPRLRALEVDLREREMETRELRTILDTATDGVAVLDAQGAILTLNRSAEALFGYEQADVAGESFVILLARDSHPTALDYLEGLKSNGVASVMNDGREVLGRARQGGAIPLYMTLGRIAVGGEQKFCAVLRDLTPWKKIEREIETARKDAEHASALKSDFLAKVSHEIRTPLNAILGFAEVIMEERFGPIGNERYKDYLKDIHSSGAHVMSLVNDLLDLSKIEAGKLELTFGSVDANRIVSECISLMQPQASRARVIIRSSLAQRLPNIVADERSLRQIVLNLLSNAVKFNEAGGQVIVSTALTDAGHAVIRIRDTGIGMSDSELQVAMEPFRQIATARRAGGTGLGLPLTKALVEANRASFTIKSKQNDGTLIEVAFPPTRVLAE